MLKLSECPGRKAPSSLYGPSKRKVDCVIPASMKTMVPYGCWWKFLVSGPAHALEPGSWFSRVCMSRVAEEEPSHIICASESHAENLVLRMQTELRNLHF